VAAGWIKADAIILPSAFDVADIYGDIGQYDILINKYSVVD